MKLSTKARYGIRAMLELALSESQWPLAIKTIAERQAIPEPYLEQLMSLLKKAGLVSSTRGAQGGYRLADLPSQISVGQVIRALEGSLAPVSCVEDDEFCSHSETCTMRLLWERINVGLEGVYDSITLADMVNDHKKQAEICVCER